MRESSYYLDFRFFESVFSVAFLLL